jgi:hypothetical protein
MKIWLNVIQIWAQQPHFASVGRDIARDHDQSHLLDRDVDSGRGLYADIEHDRDPDKTAIGWPA